MTRIAATVGVISTRIVSGYQNSVSTSKELYVNARPYIHKAKEIIQDSSRKLRKLWRDDAELSLVYGALCALFTICVLLLPDVPYENNPDLKHNLIIFLLTFMWIPTYCMCTGLARRLIVSIVKTNCYTSQHVKSAQDMKRFFGVTASFWCFFGAARLFFVVMFFAFFDIYKYRGCCFLYMFLFLYSELFIWHLALVCVREVRRKQNYNFGLSQDMEREYDTLAGALRTSDRPMASSRYGGETLADEDLQHHLLPTDSCVTNHF